ncbi:hypothetical protein PLICRDRAFT_695520 [Plicaturopsis crispa FD-325 SS-3]|nr:hypothetical protein PLICRDRAFT_695520 [Plicaturopsis crispa FD-325 SS-3]
MSSAGTPIVKLRRDQTLKTDTGSHICNIDIAHPPPIYRPPSVFFPSTPSMHAPGASSVRVEMEGVGVEVASAGEDSDQSDAAMPASSGRGDEDAEDEVEQDAENAAEEAARTLFDVLQISGD